MVGGDESKIHVVYCKIQLSFFVGKVLQEKDGMSSLMSLQESVRVLMRRSPALSYSGSECFCRVVFRPDCVCW